MRARSPSNEAGAERQLPKGGVLNPREDTPTRASPVRLLTLCVVLGLASACGLRGAAPEAQGLPPAAVTRPTTGTAAAPTAVDPSLPWYAWETPPAPAPASASQVARLLALIAPPPAPPAFRLPSGTLPPVSSPASGWLPDHRLVAYYGNPLSPSMGVLDWYAPDVMISKLEAQAAAYQTADPLVPVVPVLDLVADVAQGSPQPDHTYRMRMPYSLIAQELALARDHRMLLMLEIQVGRSSVQAELPYFEPFLSQPDVEVALDPEFAMPKGERPGVQIGTLSAEDINWSIRYVAGLVARYHLPPKVFVVHQFRQDMVPDWRGISLVPGIQFVMDTDGYGGQQVKLSNYRSFITDQPIPPVRYGGIKLFYKYDAPPWGNGLLTPAQVLALDPPPSLIIYQ